MKKVLSLLLCFCLFLSLSVSVAADPAPTLTLTAPSKVFYQVGEAPDYSGGMLSYIGEDELTVPLAAEHCTGLDTSTPGNKTVTVQLMEMTAYFRVTVLMNEEPILEMKDVSPKAWYYKSLAACMKAGFFKGNEQKKAMPRSDLSRAQLATLLYRIYESDPQVMAPKGDAVAPFTDVQPTDWFYDAVENCRAAGIIEGGGDGTFNPNGSIKREDAILMIIRTLYTPEEIQAADPEALLAASGLKVSDFDQISGYAKKAVALGLGALIKGNEKGDLNPKNTISRAEIATILERQFLAGYGWASSVRVPLVYLSPSNQIHNRYAAGNTTEGDEMIKVAGIVEKILKDAGYQVINAPVTKPIKERAKEANSLQVDAYVALHTNAGSGAYTTGTEAYYNGANAGSKELATEIYNRIVALTGKGRKLKEDFVCLQGGNGTPFVEVGDPKVANLLLEIEYHDKADRALWICNHTDAIAKAVAAGIMAYCEAYVDLTTPLPATPPAQEKPSEEKPPQDITPPPVAEEQEEEELPTITGKPPLPAAEENTPEENPEENPENNGGGTEENNEA